MKLKKILPIILLSATYVTISLSNSSTVKVDAATLYEASALPTTIDLNDSTSSQIRSYYSSLSSLSETERRGDNLLKNLKPILSNNQKYYNYDSADLVWRMYEISDRDWSKSPATELGSKYNANTNIITGYTYKSDLNPYVKSYYMDYTQENQVQAWGNHNQNGYGINREHLWAKAEGFNDDSSGAGARGDPMHLVAANGYANNLHSNYFFGYVDKTKSYTDSNTKYASVGHNLKGRSKTFSSSSVTVFEPQDADKGDIARAIFYMAARYNNIANNDSTIGGANPNLRLTNDLTKWANAGYTSTTTTCGYMGLIDDLLEWNKLDPVDDYEIHRNNILFKNFTNNRNPFIDFPQWADLIWGDSSTTKSADVNNDALNNKEEDNPITSSSSEQTSSSEQPSSSSEQPTSSDLESSCGESSCFSSDSSSKETESKSSEIESSPVTSQSSSTERSETTSEDHEPYDPLEDLILGCLGSVDGSLLVFIFASISIGVLYIVFNSKQKLPNKKRSK